MGFEYSAFHQITMTMFTAERLRVLAALTGALEESEAWAQRWAVEAYVQACIHAGFCKTSDQMILCARRYLAGKRKVTPPGTSRKKREAKERAEMMKKLPPELTAAVDAAIAETPKAVEQYKQGLEKAVNSLVGAVMRKYKTDPAVVKELLMKKLS